MYVKYVQCYQSYPLACLGTNKHEAKLTNCRTDLCKKLLSEVHLYSLNSGKSASQIPSLLHEIYATTWSVSNKTEWCTKFVAHSVVHRWPDQISHVLRCGEEDFKKHRMKVKRSAASLGSNATIASAPKKPSLISNKLFTILLKYSAPLRRVSVRRVLPKAFA